MYFWTRNCKNSSYLTKICPIFTPNTSNGILLGTQIPFKTTLWSYRIQKMHFLQILLHFLHKIAFSIQFYQFLPHFRKIFILQKKIVLVDIYTLSLGTKLNGLGLLYAFRFDGIFSVLVLVSSFNHIKNRQIN